MRWRLKVELANVLLSLPRNNIFGHFLARERAKFSFPNIPARRPYFEKKNPKTFENSLIPLLKLETKVAR